MLGPLGSAAIGSASTFNSYASVLADGLVVYATIAAPATLTDKPPIVEGPRFLATK